MRRSVVTVKIAFVGKAPGPALLNKVRDLEERLEADNRWNDQLGHRGQAPFT